MNGSAKLVLELTSFFTKTVERVVEAAVGYGSLHDARSFEATVKQQVDALGAVLMESTWVMRMQEQQIPSSLPCECGLHKHKKGRMPRTIETVLGTVELKERYYFRCDKCGSSEVLGDELRGFSDYSQLAEERMAYAGKEDEFEKAAETLEHQGILKVTGATIRRVCLRLAERLKKKTDADMLRQYEREGIKPEDRPSHLAVGIDGVMVGRIDEQHRHRKSEKKGPVPDKGKLEHFFHEVKTLVMFSFDEEGETQRKTYYATQQEVEAFRTYVALEAQRRQADLADVLAFLGDGAPWIWKTAQELFPDAVEILDWYHAMEHIWAIGRARFGSEEKAIWAWVKAHELELWGGQVTNVIEAIRTASQELGLPDQSLSETARASDPRWIAHRGIHYFETNASRMDYPSYRARNLPIGSGTVESACKHVVAKRMKGSGMRWDEPGAEAILDLRCAYLNGRWNELWPAPIFKMAS